MCGAGNSAAAWGASVGPPPTACTSQEDQRQQRLPSQWCTRHGADRVMTPGPSLLASVPTHSAASRSGASSSAPTCHRLDARSLGAPLSLPHQSC